MGSTACLKLGEQMPHVRLHRFLGEEEALADLAVHEAVGDELQHLDLASRRLLCEFARAGGLNAMTAPERLVLRRAAAASKRRLWSR